MENPPEIPEGKPEDHEIESRISELLPEEMIDIENMNQILDFFHSHSDPLFTAQETYFILGSYKKHPLRRLRLVENKLNRRTMTYAFILADLLNPTDLGQSTRSDDIPWTHIEFHLLCEYVDNIVAVLEGRHAGPSVELGELTQSKSHFHKSYVLQRIYDGFDDSKIKTNVDPKNAYSQVQLDKFSIFNSLNRLHKWSTKKELIAATKAL